MIKRVLVSVLTILGISSVLVFLNVIRIRSEQGEHTTTSTLGVEETIGSSESDEMTAWCFRQIWNGLVEYDSAWGHLPYSTVYKDKNLKSPPLTSWRYLIVPWLASYGRDIEPMIPWNSESNSWWRQIPQCYAYGAWNDGILSIGKPGINQETRAYAVAGRGSAFGDGSYRPMALKNVPYDTILVVEVINSKCHWMEPKDFDINAIPNLGDKGSQPSISSIHDSGFFVLFADGEVWQLRHSIPIDDLKKFFLPQENRSFDRDVVLAPYRVQELTRNGERPR